jgi:hypothetical protein
MDQAGTTTDLLTEDEKETIEAIFVKTISAGGMELAQGVRYLLNRDMGVVLNETGIPLKERSTSLTKKFERTIGELEVKDTGYRRVVWEGLIAGEGVLSKMM